MSVEIPYVTIGFGSVGVPRADVVECRVHLGCTREVGSFEVVVQNWNRKYSPGGSYPINVGVDGYIKIGRSADPPQVLSCRVESVECESSADEHYIRVKGRCWGERLFRRVFTGTFQNMKGEDIVKYLLDHYVGLSHVRNGVELVENTDTLYTWLEYENTPVWDIIKYIAESADKQGVVGFDFRIAPDGKFEFFPKNSKTSPLSLTDKIEVCEYKRDIHRLRNRIFVLGEAGKKLPADADEDGFTESTSNWSSYFYGHIIATDWSHVKADGQITYADAYSVSVYSTEGAVYRDRTGFYRTFNAVKCREQDGFKRLRFWLRWSSNGPTPLSIKVKLHTTLYNYFYREIVSLAGARNEWKKIELNLEDYWAPYGNPDWNNINSIGFEILFEEGSTPNPILWVDHIVFEDCRFSAVQEDTASQNQYGLRELTETDEELRSDSECLLRAKALLAHLNGVAEYLTVKSTVLDYGNTPLLPGDKIHVTLPNENVDSDFRIESVEYRVDAKTQTLEVSLELGRAPPLLADYLYGLRSTTVTVEKLARTKVGKGFVTAVSRAPAAHTHDSLLPSQPEQGFIGNSLYYFDQIHAKQLYLYKGDNEPYGQIQFKVTDEYSPRLRLGIGYESGKELYGLELGPGSSSPVDTWLRRIDVGAFWLKDSFGPFADSPAIVKFRTKNRDGDAAVNHLFQPSDNKYGCLGSENFHWREVHTQRLTAYDDDGQGDIRVKTQNEDNPKARLTKEQLEFGAGGASTADVYIKRSGDNTLEVKAWELLPNTDNTLKLGSSAKRLAKIYAVEMAVTNMVFNFNLTPDQDDTYDLGSSSKRWRNLYVSGTASINHINAGHVYPFYHDLYDLGTEGTCWRNLWLSGYIKALLGVDTHLLPSGDASYDLGSSSKRWNSLHVAGLASAGWLNIGGFTVLTQDRVLQNIVSAVVGQCMPPAADYGAVGTTSLYWNCIAGNSVWYKALGQFDALDDLALIKRIRGNGKVDEKGIPLADPESLPPEVTENGLINAGHLMGLLIGAVKQLTAKVEALEKQVWRFERKREA